jgi:hypothetical protein
MTPGCRRILRRLPSLILTVGLFLSWAAVVPASAREWKGMPWHLMDFWWDFPQQTAPLYLLSMDMELAGDDISASSIYVAPLGLEEIDGAPFYAGLQTGADNSHGGGGKIGIFSRWKERDPKAIREAPGGFSENSDDEDGFIGVRQVIPWHAGRYRFSLTVETPQGADSRPWVRAEVLELATGMRWQVGALRFPDGPQAHLGKSLATFVEIFGGTVDPDRVPHFTATFSNLRINDAPVPSTGGHAIFNQNIPPLAAVRAGGPGTIIVDVGGMHQHVGATDDGKGYLYQRLQW